MLSYDQEYIILLCTFVMIVVCLIVVVEQYKFLCLSNIIHDDPCTNVNSRAVRGKLPPKILAKLVSDNCSVYLHKYQKCLLM